VVVVAAGLAARRHSLLTVAGCAETSQSPPALSPVAITDIGSVAGKWAGPVTGLTTRRDEGDWVNVVIGPDGTYDFGIYSHDRQCSVGRASSPFRTGSWRFRVTGEIRR
jgi:hypothetical protein